MPDSFYRLKIEKKTHFKHYHPFTKQSVYAGFTGLIVDEENIGAWFIDPADEKIAFKKIFRTIPLKIGFSIKVRRKRIDEPAGNNICRKFSALDRQVKLIAVKDKFHTEMTAKFEITISFKT